MEHPSDEDLMQSAMRGNRAAISSLVERHYAPLFGYLFRLTDGDRHGAEDLLHDTFTRLLSPRTYTPGRAVKPWLYAIATNLVRDRYRRHARRGSDQQLELVDTFADEREPADQTLQSEDAQAVRQAIGTLNDEQRVAIVMRFYQGLSLSEIALALDIPVGTVKSRLSIGSRRLRALLQPLREDVQQNR